VQKIIHFIVVVLLSSVKFIGGPTLVYLNEKYEPEFGFLQANIACISGGMLGVVVFMYFSKWILKIYRSARKKMKKIFSRNHPQYYDPPVADITSDVEIRYNYVDNNEWKKKIFSPRSRRMVRIWQRYGLVGLAALTPILFSIPLGTFVMSRLESNRKKILLYMFISIVSWSLILTTLFEVTHARYIHDLIK
jgi:uncharacterized membrane protein YbhN (UPF0104 family)